MNLDTNLTRRTAIGGALATALAMAVPVGASARRSSGEESWESVDEALTVTYDPEIWHDVTLGDKPSNGVTLATAKTGNRPMYWLSIGSGKAIWSSVEDAEANAQDAWFSQGMNGSVVSAVFSTDDAYGWVHYADFQGRPRTVSSIQYLLPGDGSMTTVQLSIDMDAYEDLDIGDVFDAVSLNDESVFLIASQPKMVAAIEDAFAT